MPTLTVFVVVILSPPHRAKNLSGRAAPFADRVAREAAMTMRDDVCAATEAADLMRLSRCGEVLFCIRDDGREARIAVKRIQVGVLIDGDVALCRKSVVDSLAQE